MRRRTRRVLAVALIASCAASLAAQAPANTSPTRFQSAIDAFIKGDSSTRPAPGGVLFTGSSIFRLWKTVGEDMAPLPAFNRAFGGSQTPDLLYYMDKVVLQYRPRFVVYYCGSNDVNAGSPADSTIRRIREFHARLQRELPATRMFFVSVIRAPDKRRRWAVVDSVNAAMRAFAAKAKNLEYIEINQVLVDEKGEVRAALYLPDSLHYKPEAYPLFTGVIKPVLERAWREK